MEPASKVSLQVNVSAPILDGRLPPSLDTDLALDLIGSLPLSGEWLSDGGSLVSRGRRQCWQTGFDRSGRQWQLEYQPGLEEARKKVHSDDWSAVGVGALLLAGKDPSDGFRRYELLLNFISDPEKGEYLDGWGGFQMTLQLAHPGLIDDSFGESLREFVRQCSLLVGGSDGVYGYAGVEGGPLSVEGYGLANYGPPRVQVATIPGVEWLFILPPGAVDRLGGSDALFENSPFYRIDSVCHPDESISCVVQLAPSPWELDRRVVNQIEEFLGPVLARPEQLGPA